jgi:imidazolonepropionase-like amidohydrolase
MRIRTAATGVPEAQVVIDQVPRRLLDRFAGLAEQAAGMARDDISDAVSGGVIGPGRGILGRALRVDVRRTADKVIAAARPARRAAFLFRHHDQGFHGEVKVRQHTRMGFKAFGRSYWPKRHSVFAHVRRIDYPGHHFVEPAAQRAGHWLMEQLHEVAP